MNASDPFRSQRRSGMEFPLQSYGTSVKGVPLEWLPPSEGDDCRMLVLAGVHGEEPETTVVLSRALRCLATPAKHVGFVPVVNPDGLLLGTRGNARGVDLNRNFPASNWRAEPLGYRWHVDCPEESLVPIETGSAPASEPESQALLDLMKRVQPDRIVALHAPLACIDDPDASETGRWLAERTGMPLVTQIGYPTPGSMGSWAIETGVALITWEFPRQSIEELSREVVPVLLDLFLAVDEGRW